MVPLAVRSRNATSLAELRKIAFELHDSWIDVPESLELQTSGTIDLHGSLIFGYSNWKRTVGPLVRVELMKPMFCLTIRNVLSVELDDFAQIGGFNLVSITYDKSRNCIVMNGGVPVTLTIFVESLSLSLNVSGEFVKRGERWSLKSGARVRDPSEVWSYPRLRPDRGA